MLTSSRHQNEMVPDREEIDLEDQKTSLSKPANPWCDSHDSIEDQLINEDSDKSPMFNAMLDEAEQNEDFLFDDNEVKEDLKSAEAEDKMATIDESSSRNQSPKNRLLLQARTSRTSLLKAKRARVEYIVTSIKDNPSRYQGLDLTQTKSSSLASTKANDHISIGSTTQCLRKRQNEERTFQTNQEMHDNSQYKESFEIRNEGDYRECSLSKKQRLEDKNNIENRPQDSLEYSADRFIKSSFGDNRNLLNDPTYEKLVETLKRELISVLDRIAEKSAKHIMNELKQSMADIQSLERNKLLIKYFDSRGEKSFNSFSEKIALNFEPRSSYIEDNKNFSLPSNKKENSNQISKYQSEFVDGFNKNNREISSHFKPFYSHLMESYNKLGSMVGKRPSENDSDTPQDEFGEQTEALSLVKKKQVPIPVSTSSFIRNSCSNEFNSKVKTNLNSEIHRKILNSINSPIAQTSLKSRTPSPSLRSSASKGLETSLMQETNFPSSSSSSYRFPFNNPSLVASTFRRDQLGSSSMLRNPFSYPPSVYSPSGQSHPGFPFPSGHLPFPFFHSLQQQRNLANALAAADYNSRLREGNDLPAARSSSTRTSTREVLRHQAYTAKQLDPKNDSMSYLNHLPASSIQEGLTPQHLKKAKIMFFYTRYPSANTLKTYFPDVKFSRATTSQLIKWFSNFREFFYIQIEKFARLALTDGITDTDQLQVNKESELFRILNLHYNKCSDFKVPNEFLDVTLSSLEEFFIAIQQGKDQDPSWKKPIYKVICKLDQDVPTAFKLPNVLERLNEIA